MHRPVSPARVWIVEDARFDEARRELHVGGSRRNLETKPLALLHTLLCKAGEVATKDELLRTVWPGVTVTDGSLTTAISKLRAALGPRGRAIVKPVHGVGYRIGVPIELAASSDPARLAFGLQAGETVPNRPQWRLERQFAASGVWLVRHDRTGEARVFKFADSAERLDELKREVVLSRVLLAVLGDRPDLIRPVEWNFDDRPWYSESPFGGLGLGEWTRSHGGLAKLTTDARIAIVARVARTLAAAHQVGVLHCDLKPSNILIDASDAEAGQVRLIDFGAGLLTDAACRHAAASTGLTVCGPVGRRRGTPCYMAPELLAGAAATTASDVYALGILLYQLVVGDLDRPLAAGWEADIDDPVLREDVAAAAAGNPDRRLPSAALLADRLENRAERAAALRRQEADALLRADLARRLERVRTRRPWLALAGASLVLGLVGVGVAATRAVHEGRLAKREAAVARAVNTFLTADLIGRASPGASGEADETLIEAATRAESHIDERFAGQPLVAATVYAALADAFGQRGAFEAARQAYDKAIGRFETVQGAGSPEATILRLKRAVMEGAAGNGADTAGMAALIAAARARFASLGPRRREAETWLVDATGLVQLRTGDMDAALVSLRAAAEQADGLPAAFTVQQRIAFRKSEAFALLRAGRFADAGRLLDQLLPRAEAVEGARSADALALELDIARSLTAQGRAAAALSLLDRIAPGFAAFYGPRHRLTLVVTGLRAQALALLGRYGEAIEADATISRTAIAQHGVGWSFSILALNDLATLQCRAGRLAEGTDTARRGYDAARDGFGRDAAIAEELAATLAFCDIEDSDGPEAAALMRSVDAGRVADVTSDPSFPAEADLTRAAIAFAAGDDAAGSALLRRPVQDFHQPGADPFLRRWTDRLAGLPAVARQTVSAARDLPDP